MAKSELTPKLVAKAETREGIYHPVLTALEDNAQILQTLSQEYIEIDEHSFLTENYGFFADAVIAQGPFSFTPEDVVAIWSRIIELDLQRHERYALTQMIISAYIIQDLEDPRWKTFPRLFFENFVDDKNTIPEGLEEDFDSIQSMRLKLENEIMPSKADISEYVRLDNHPVVSEANENLGNCIMPVRYFLSAYLETNG